MRKACIKCGREYEKPKTCGLPEWNGRKFCSIKCKNKSQTGNPTWVKGVKTGFIPKSAFKKGQHPSFKTEFKKGMFQDEKNTNWKGKNVGYYALHSWIYRRLGKANHCELCGLKEIPKSKKRWFDWANKSNTYKRNLKDWMQLCRPCHRQYDKGRIAIFNKK